MPCLPACLPACHPHPDSNPSLLIGIHIGPLPSLSIPRVLWGKGTCGLGSAPHLPLFLLFLLFLLLLLLQFSHPLTCEIPSGFPPIATRFFDIFLACRLLMAALF